MQISVFPNPATDYLKISPVDGVGSVKIYSLDGQELMSTVLNNNQLDISSLRNGIYIVQIETGEQVYRQKFIKQ